MRIGVHTGPVVVGTLGNNLMVEFKAVGDTVNLVSRMEGLWQITQLTLIPRYFIENCIGWLSRELGSMEMTLSTVFERRNYQNVPVFAP